MALSNQAPAARTSLLYITGGSVMIVWTVVWLFYLLANPPESGKVFFAVFGFMATGGVLLLIGIRLGAIGRSAKQAESPPAVVQVAAPPTVATTDQNGAVPVNTVTMPAVASPGQHESPTMVVNAPPRVVTRQ
jgi:hypothetical protein